MLTFPSNVFFGIKEVVHEIQKIISLVLSIMTFSMLFVHNAYAVEAKLTKAQIDIPPDFEYREGNIVLISVIFPIQSQKLEYKVSVYNNTTKKQLALSKELLIQSSKTTSGISASIQFPAAADMVGECSATISARPAGSKTSSWISVKTDSFNVIKQNDYISTNLIKGILKNQNFKTLQPFADGVDIIMKELTEYWQDISPNIGLYSEKQFTFRRGSKPSLLIESLGDNGYRITISTICSTPEWSFVSRFLYSTAQNDDVIYNRLLDITNDINNHGIKETIKRHNNKTLKISDVSYNIKFDKNNNIVLTYNGATGRRVELSQILLPQTVKGFRKAVNLKKSYHTVMAAASISADKITYGERSIRYSSKEPNGTFIMAQFVPAPYGYSAYTNYFKYYNQDFDTIIKAMIYDTTEDAPDVYAFVHKYINAYITKQTDSEWEKWANSIRGKWIKFGNTQVKISDNAPDESQITWEVVH